ncbi:MAG: deoxyribonuclease IV [Thermodesulforhabdaceae bacterium]
MKLGAHESISGGLHKAFDRAVSAGCEALQIFLESSRSWQTKILSEEEIRLFKKKAAETGISPVLGHASYLINLATPDDVLWRKSCRMFLNELERCEVLGIPCLIIHPGSHMGKGETEGLRRVAQALKDVLIATSGFKTKILLETTAGQGTSLGYQFEHLAWLMENTCHDGRIGICLDTCHIFAAGYDIRTLESYEATMHELDKVIGLRHVHAIHLNDSKTPLGSRIDRHEHIGKGALGIEAFRLIVNDHRFTNLPGLIETPKDATLEKDRENLSVLRSLANTRRKTRKELK